MPASAIVKPKGRQSGPVLKELRPEEFRAAVRQAKAGEPMRYFPVLEEFWSVDDEIRPALESLSAAVLSRGAHNAPDDDSDEAKTQAHYLDAVFDELDADALIEHFVGMKYFGVRGAEFDQWGTVTSEGRERQAPVHYEALPQSWFYAKKETAQDDYATMYVGADPLYTYGDDSGVIVLTDQKLQRSRGVDFTQLGVGKACARLACMRYFAPEDWAAFNEVFGMPLVLGVLLKGFSKDDRKMLEDAVFGMSSDARAVISENTRLEFPEVNRASSAETFDRFWAVLGAAISRLIKSETMTDHSNKYGSNAAMMTTNGVRLDVAARIARRIQRQVNRRLVRPTLTRVFGRALAHFSLPLAEIVDLVAQARVDRDLHEIGFPLSKSEMSARYDRRIADDDDRLTPPNSPFTGF